MIPLPKLPELGPFEKCDIHDIRQIQREAMRAALKSASDRLVMETTHLVRESDRAAFCAAAVVVLDLRIEGEQP